MIRSKRGDTIVEVLIAVAVLGLIIAAGFAIANRSLRGVRRAQERSEALKIAERQIERIKHFSKSAPSSFFRNGARYCVLSSGATAPENDAACKEGPDGRYATVTEVNATGEASGQYIFTITVTWTRLGGDGQDILELYYKAYRGDD